VAQAAGVNKLILTHHNANHDDAFLEDIERQAQAVFPGTIMAREGLTLEL
jgi:ribonuclease BN (tRNA processing enzyme)